jgi:hypothetical protein
MQVVENGWVLLVYRLPQQPSRLRLTIWRKLQRMGAVYLHNSAWVLPDRPELVENMHYVAGAIEEMGGSCQLFAATAMLPGGTERIAREFGALADERLGEVIERLDRLSSTLSGIIEPNALEQAEEDLKRERVAYLRARRLAHCGSTRGAEVDARIDKLRRALDELYRSET